MRTIRALTIATAAAAVVLLLPSIAAAQNGRQFKDAWFWGVKAGSLTLADSSQSYKQAPMVGIDWMITRSRGGLYISGTQSFFTRQALTLRDPTAGLDSGYRAIDLKNMRRLDIALMGFPGEHLRFHPYIGAGFSLSQVASAEPEGPFGNTDQVNAAAQVVQEQRTAVAPMLIGGGQYSMTRFSVFGQAEVIMSNSNFLLYNGKPFNLGIELGLRYNVGSSIDRN
ncbi:MAG TPA: hypothetical protein VGM67_04295 [Gemmatimonadaceae bacterium]|jgi:hypothetical protein